MIRQALLGLLLVPLARSASGQSVLLSFMTGVSASTQSDLSFTSAVERKGPRWAPTVGVSAENRLSRTLRVQLGANYVKKGYWIPGYSLNDDYLEFPLLARLTLPVRGTFRPSLLAGVAGAVQLTCSVDDRRFGISEIIYNPGYQCGGHRTRRWDTSLMMGVGVEVGSGRTRPTAQVRYSHAVTNLYAPDGSRGYNRSLSFLLGFDYVP